MKIILIDMTNEITKIVFMMSVENMHGREMLTWLLNFSFPITAIIIEHKSKRAERVRNARYNEYNPNISLYFFSRAVY